MNPSIYSYRYLFNTWYSNVTASKMVINEKNEHNMVENRKCDPKWR